MTDLDDLPVFRPRIRIRHPAASGREGSFRNTLLARLRRGAAAARRSPRGGAGAGARQANARRIVVKAHVVRMSPSGAKAAALHLRYIERAGVEKDGSKGVLYTADGPAHAETFEQLRAGEKHQFRLIVSPEDGSELDLTAYVRRLMVTVERDLGRRMEWAAVNHYDTGHPHAHVVVRGVDRDGQELRLDRAYISRGLRWRAQELATDELGPRRELDVRRAHAREVAQDRFTALDRELERRAKDSRFEVRSGRPGLIDESMLVARLEHLEGHRLAERLSPTSWKLTEGWQDHMREVGSRGDILAQIHAAVAGDRTRYRIVRAGQALEKNHVGGSDVVDGRVASKGLSDELKGAFYAIVEAPTGHAYHVPLDPRSAEGVRAGDLVSLTTQPDGPVRPADRQIAELARARGGVYTLEPAVGGAAHPHERRLRELERLGLVAREGPQRWRVSPTLLEDLAAQHRDRPIRHRVLLRKQPLSLREQVRHPGPVWLDRVETDGLAPHGLGAEVRRALAERREVLRRLGIEPGDPNRGAKVRELERRRVGAEIAARARQTFLPTAPADFRGRVQVGKAGPYREAYAIVSDGERFVVLRATSALGAAESKTVTLTRDPKGRLIVRPSPEHDLGR